MQPASENTRRIIIFTDLDGTLLDRETYSYQEAVPALNLIKSEKIPLIFCSAKTRAEQEYHREEMGISDPFIVEDGGAIFIDDGYFPFDYDYDKTLNGYHVIEIGSTYSYIRKAIFDVSSNTGIYIRGYGDADVTEVAKATGLDNEAARRAMTREYEETLLSDFDPRETEKLRIALYKHGLNLSHGGRFYAVKGSNDKGQAVSLVTDLFRKQYSSITTIGIGDSENDSSLLSKVDVPILVQKSREIWENLLIPGLRPVEGVGPVGWNRFILGLLS
jgi:mannosyl-3-phosphoglycerate phosphatase